VQRREFITLLAAGLVGSLAGSAVADPADGKGCAGIHPDFAGRATPSSLKSFRGKPVLVNFWGFGVTPTANGRAPVLEALYAKYKTRGLVRSSAGERSVGQGATGKAVRGGLQAHLPRGPGRLGGDRRAVSGDATPISLFIDKAGAAGVNSTWASLEEADLKSESTRC